MKKVGNYFTLLSDTMPKHYKNQSRNNKSQKSTSSTSSTPVEDDDGFGGLLKITTPSSRRSTPKNTTPEVRPEFLEPLSPTPVVLTPPPPPPTPWEVLGMKEEDFVAMQERVFQRAREYDRELYIENMLNDLKNPAYWLRRIESLEKEREYFNKKRGWSAAEMVCVERIDAEIQECEDEVDRIYAEEDRIEAEYD